jgi:uncharacterized membrane protein (UPF0127 family)
LKINTTKKILLAFIKVIVVIVTALVVAWIYFFARTYMSYSSFKKEKILIKSSLIVGYIADTPEKRVIGLSDRDFLPSNTGMLFKFDTSDIYGIWMKDMHFPIDIIWLDKNKVVVNLKHNVDPSTYPFVFYPPKASLYVLEVRAGFINDKGLKLGDEILFGQSHTQ